jgi:ribosomal protein L11 methyltransferase
VPYRVDIRDAGDTALDRLVELGALDVELSSDGGLAALMPDSISPREIATALGVKDVAISPVIGRDAGSVWVLSPRPTHIGRLHIVPAHIDAEPGALRLIDSSAFGTGLHATTAMCLEALDEAVQTERPERVLDVGTGSGVLALGALLLGVPRTFAIDIDEGALRAAAENARINGLDTRVRFARGGPEAVTGTWPLVIANVLSAPLIEMAPVLVRRMGHRGLLVLSGIARSLEHDVEQAYVRLGMRRVSMKSRKGWVALAMRALW